MAIDWTTIFEIYQGLWVALNEDEQTVVGSGKTLQEALEGVCSGYVDMPCMAYPLLD